MSSESSNFPLSDRAQHLLKVLVKEYIRYGQPVGSKALAMAASLDLSPATIRNIMSDLESHGFLHSPHTSAGRVPTVQGYRFFVDSLVTATPMDETMVDRLKLQLEHGQDTQQLVLSVSEFLSGVTRLASVVTLPRLQRLELRRVEFLSLSENRLLAILVTNEREVHNRIIQLPRRFSSDELHQIASYLNAQFGGKEICQVREDLLQEMKDARDSMNQMMRAAVEMAEQLFTQQDEAEEYVLRGETNLMDFEELSNVKKLRELFEAFNQKRDILHLLDQCFSGQGVQIFIGEESGYKVLGDCSVVTSTYSIGGKVLGVVGVIGPTRMPYDMVIPTVDITARILGAALNSK
jgi:heat-inducible transcriptional repressor